ncbi:ras-associated and pleckstrin-like proteiny domains-containing protein 1 isoform A [Patagioenas fasciata monilis]|uniref:Ras-associated and pleckstrin-like proteiny domains-containing protein 1 isoform A n=1 Tax=Patagioenas fasciata monilis TaxID=372326 RepID=A0A1V4KZZ8_PATFA|nr:ras-associated and pleckstrin-like proteiny domains-containing protein 1 isoform A [Patagioenas fasciata monilis]
MDRGTEIVLPARPGFLVAIFSGVAMDHSQDETVYCLRGKKVVLHHKKMEQLSDEELDHGAEEDSDKEDQDLDKMFGAWLGELDKLTQSLDTDKAVAPVKRSPLRQETNLANFSYRFSMYNLNEALNQGETVDLDALMADLCSIEQELSSIGSHSANNAAVKHLAPESKAQKPPASRPSAKPSSMKGLSSSSGKVTKPSHANVSLDDITAQLEKASLSMDEAAQQSVEEDTKPVVTAQHRRTASAGTVSDAEVRSISNSSRSSITSAASSMDSLDIDKVTRPQELDLTSQGQVITEHSYLDRETSLLLRNIAGKPSHLLTKEEQAAKLKAEKIRVALEKIKEAQVKKLVIRVHMSDDSSKTMMVDERQTVRQVLDNLMDKSHCGYSLDWSLVETISELQMERIFEDHENLVENLLNWTRDSQNKLMFVERIEKYALFKNPQNYLLGKKETSEMADRNKEVLLEECFCGSSVTVPEIEGVLWLKEDGKKSWKKRYFLLRASGIYYVPKGKAKVSRDLVCFLQLDHVNVYYGQDYRNKYKAPTDYCLVLKHPQIQKKSQYIKYLCCDDVRTLHQWINGIRIAKYGKQLYMNYQEALKRTESAYDWTSLSSSSIKSGSSSSSLPESQSNHSNQSDSGVSDTQPAGHVRSQSIVSSMFSEAWKRGTQLEESSKVSKVKLSTAESPPAVKAKPKWQPASAPSPDFPPPPPESSLVFPPPPPSPASSAGSPPLDKSGSPVKKTGKTSSPGGKKPPPTPQRNSSIKSTSSTEYHESKRPSVDRLVSKFAHPPEPSGSPSKESSPSAPPPKPGKLNLSGVGLPIVLPQGGILAKPPAPGVSGKEPVVEFPSPPSDSDFPPPPPEIDLPLPPVEIPSVFSGSTSPKVAVVNPQPQVWSKPSVKKAPPPTRPKRNDSTRLTQAEVTEPPGSAGPQVPTSPKSSLSVQPGFLADLNRTLQRKSITRHGSLSSARMSRAEPTATMDDMALPPPPPELLADQQKTSSFGGSHISGYATLRRGPPPAPPKRDQNTKLSRDW